MEGKYCVLLKNPLGADPQAVSRVLVQQLKLLRFEADARARKTYGFLAEQLSESQAASLVQACSAEGVEALSVKEDSLAVLPAAKNCRAVDCAPGSLKFTFDGDEAGSSAWEDVLVVAAGSIAGETSKTVTEKKGNSTADVVMKTVTLATMGIPVTFSRKKEETRVVKETTRSNCVEFLLRDRAYRAHIDADNVNYAYLGARKEYSTAINFRTLLADIEKYSPKSLKNSGYRALMKKETLANKPYESYRDFEKEARWLYALSFLTEGR